MAACGPLNCLIFSRNENAVEIRFDVVGVGCVPLELDAFAWISCSLSSLSPLISLLAAFDDWLFDNCTVELDCLLPSECCKLLIRSRNDTFGFVGIGLALGSMRPVTMPVVVLADAFSVQSMVLADTESLMVVTVCDGPEV